MSRSPVPSGPLAAPALEDAHHPPRRDGTWLEGPVAPDGVDPRPLCGLLDPEPRTPCASLPRRLHWSVRTEDLGARSTQSHDAEWSGRIIFRSRLRAAAATATAYGN